MRKIREVLRLRFEHGLSARQIAASCRLSPSTVGRIVDGASKAGISWPLPEGADEDDLRNRIYQNSEGGGEEEIDVDVRIISATNRDIMSMTREGTFREDLLYRLFVTGIHVPPLRERPEDIESIANDYLLRRGLSKLDKASLEALQAHDWAGNVRELQNVLERAIVMGESDFGKIIAEQSKLFPVNEVPNSDLLDDVVKTHVAKVLQKHDGNKTRARKALGISFNTLQKHLKSAGRG